MIIQYVASALRDKLKSTDEETQLGNGTLFLDSLALVGLSGMGASDLRSSINVM